MHQLSVLGMIQSIGMSETGGGIDSDLFRIVRTDQVGQGIPLVGEFGHIPGCFDIITHIISGNGRFGEYFFLRIIVKNEDGSSARIEPCSRQHGL